MGRGPPIDNAKRWMDEFPKGGLIELGHDSSAVGKIAKRFDSGQDLRYDPASDVRDILALVPAHEILEIGKGGFREADQCVRHPVTRVRGAPSPVPGTTLVRLPDLQARLPRPA